MDVKNKALLELLKKPGNNSCVDCGIESPEYASYNIGIFICSRCAMIHKGLGAHISKVKHLKLDEWEDSQVERMREVGNLAAKLKYEQRVPNCYRRPKPGDPQSILEEWICAKYMREEFSRPERQTFLSGNMEGFLMKRGKEDARYHPRKFNLSEVDGTLKYYVKETGEPKAVIALSDVNVAFAPAKLGHANSLQLSYPNKEGVTRHLFVYHDDPQTIITWYTAIRCAKLHSLQVAYPAANETELLECLCQDFTCEGWLWKTGPKPSDSFRKRWFTLDHRKLMYHENPLDAYPKGEIFLGHMMSGYSVRVGVPPGTRDDLGFTFTVRTPQRWYYLSAPTSLQRDAWIQCIDAVIDKPLTAHDKITANRLSRNKKYGNIFSR